MSFKPLVRSDRPHAAQSRKVALADPTESLFILIQLRRRLNSPPVPTLEYWTRIPFHQRKYLSRAEFAATHGASEADIKLVSDYVITHGMKVDAVNAGSRILRVSGTAGQMKNTFNVELAHYESAGGKYRGFDGFAYLPEEIIVAVEAIFGLDNRKRVRSSGGGAPPGAAALSPSIVANLYEFPSSPTGAAGQTIAIISLGNTYLPQDIQDFYGPKGPGNGLIAPNVIFPDPGAPPNYGVVTDDNELTMDIEISSCIAQGATIAVYPYTGDETLTGALGNAIHSTDPETTVVTMSFDGPEGLPPAPPNSNDPYMNTFSSLIQDAASMGITVLAVTGDSGANGGAPQGQLWLSYPGSDPGVISCGGTMITNVSGAKFDETTWNDSVVLQDKNLGATGGGVSVVFPLQSWQEIARVPVNPLTGFAGRGIPDISGNASGITPYNIFYDKIVTTGAGTSAVAPLYAGFIARLNVAVGSQVGFVTPYLYWASGCGIFRDVNDGTNNQIYGDQPAAPYVAGPGWDACTGWGSLRGSALVTLLKQIKTRPVLPLYWDGIETVTIGGLNDGSSITIIYKFGHIVGVVPHPPVYESGSRVGGELAPELAAFLTLVSLASIESSTTDRELKSILNRSREDIVTRFGSQMRAFLRQVEF